MATLAASPKFAPFLATFPSPWLYQDAESAADSLRRAGFVELQTNLEAAPTLFNGRQHYTEFVKTVILRTHLERLYARYGLHNRAGALTIWLRSNTALDVGRNADL